MEENNKIIAEFLNWDFDDLSETFETPFLKLIEPQAFGDEQFSCKLKDFELEFHSDWNWLMEVVEKIESIKDPYHGRFEVYISSNSCTIQSTNFRPDKPIPNPPHYYDNIVLNNKIESVYYSVINFINFYNKQEEK